jgi:hypothetical protein
MTASVFSDKEVVTMRHARHGHHIPNAPSRAIWIVSLVLGLLGILLHYRVVAWPTLQPYSFGIEMIAFVLLAIATTARGI